MNPLSILVKPLAALGGQYLANRDAKAARKARLEEAKLAAEIKRIETQAQAEIDWDAETLRQNAQSWKDEIFAGLFITPFLAGFFPGLHPYIEAGWQALNKAPSWYPFILLGIAAWAMGLRWLVAGLASKLPVKMPVKLPVKK